MTTPNPQLEPKRETKPLVNEFDEQGQTIDPSKTQQANTAVVEPADESAVDPAAVDPAANEATEGRYQIGDKFFATLEEAHAYATSQIESSSTDDQITDAYRQGILDASRQTTAPQNVTQPAESTDDDFNEDEYYAQPKEFLAKYAQRIKQETQQEIEKRQSVQAQSDQVWREFTERHPALADYRQEAESFVNQNLATVRKLFQTKGKAVGYDYMALELKKQFSRYAQALKPSRPLSNAKTQSPQASQSASVTQEKPVKKPMTMSEQIRSIKRRR